MDQKQQVLNTVGVSLQLQLLVCCIYMELVQLSFMLNNISNKVVLHIQQLSIDTHNISAYSKATISSHRCHPSFMSTSICPKDAFHRITAMQFPSCCNTKHISAQ